MGFMDAIGFLVIVGIALVCALAVSAPRQEPPVTPAPVSEQPVAQPSRAAVLLAGDCSDAPAGDCSDAPAGKYLSWPMPATIGFALAGLAGAAVGSGGTPEGFAVAYALNPLNWAMVWAFFKIGKIGCPHCRRAVGGDSVRNTAVGTGLRCIQCRNVFRKPAA